MKFNLWIGPEDAPMLSLNDRNWMYWVALIALFKLASLARKRFNAAWERQEAEAVTFEQKQELLSIGYLGRFFRVFYKGWLR